MAKQFAVYKCMLCGNLVEVVYAADGDLVCCGQPMKEMAAGTTDGAKEKHVPVLEATKNGCTVKVGSVAHPMEEKHFIQWIEIATDDGRRYKAFLTPGQPPEAHFCVPADKVTSVKEYCNLHGLWKA